MSLEDVIAQRYQDYITIEEVVKLIAKEYECSEEDALMVLSDAIRSNSSRDFHGDLVCDLSIYKGEKLGPKLTDSLEKPEILKNLSKENISAQEGVGFDLPF
ncbi:hypothetical protein RSO41_14180 [Halomonas sp. I1]|uniref:hypothetical protein n=1 Tax=Halomonas sp. I1 TaxID=393536 RepID=UPI0028E05C0B|nr:hypothetical protein [Halomonas sp. I1]MDT8895802.1 hypothetical protein [Halomonas sp. I1]